MKLKCIILVSFLLWYSSAQLVLNDGDVREGSVSRTTPIKYTFSIEPSNQKLLPMIIINVFPDDKSSVLDVEISSGENSWSGKNSVNISSADENYDSSATYVVSVSNVDESNDDQIEYVIIASGTVSLSSCTDALIQTNGNYSFFSFNVSVPPLPSTVQPYPYYTLYVHSDSLKPLYGSDSACSQPTSSNHKYISDKNGILKILGVTDGTYYFAAERTPSDTKSYSLVSSAVVELLLYDNSPFAMNTSSNSNGLYYGITRDPDVSSFGANLPLFQYSLDIVGSAEEDVDAGVAYISKLPCPGPDSFTWKVYNKVPVFLNTTKSGSAEDNGGTYFVSILVTNKTANTVTTNFTVTDINALTPYQAQSGTLTKAGLYQYYALDLCEPTAMKVSFSSSDDIFFYAVSSSEMYYLPTADKYRWTGEKSLEISEKDPYFTPNVYIVAAGNLEEALNYKFFPTEIVSPVFVDSSYFYQGISHCSFKFLAINNTNPHGDIHATMHNEDENAQALVFASRTESNPSQQNYTWSGKDSSPLYISDMGTLPYSSQVIDTGVYYFGFWNMVPATQVSLTIDVSNNLDNGIKISDTISSISPLSYRFIVNETANVVKVNLEVEGNNENLHVYISPDIWIGSWMRPDSQHFVWKGGVSEFNITNKNNDYWATGVWHFGVFLSEPQDNNTLSFSLEVSQYEFSTFSRKRAFYGMSAVVVTAVSIFIGGWLFVTSFIAFDYHQKRKYRKNLSI